MITSSGDRQTEYLADSEENSGGNQCNQRSEGPNIAAGRLQLFRNGLLQPEHPFELGFKIIRAVESDVYRHRCCLVSPDKNGESVSDRSEEWCFLSINQGKTSVVSCGAMSEPLAFHRKRLCITVLFRSIVVERRCQRQMLLLILPSFVPFGFLDGIKQCSDHLVVFVSKKGFPVMLKGLDIEDEYTKSRITLFVFFFFSIFVPLNSRSMICQVNNYADHLMSFSVPQLLSSVGMI